MFAAPMYENLGVCCDFLRSIFPTSGHLLASSALFLTFSIRSNGQLRSSPSSAWLARPFHTSSTSTARESVNGASTLLLGNEGSKDGSGMYSVLSGVKFIKIGDYEKDQMGNCIYIEELYDIRRS